MRSADSSSPVYVPAMVPSDAKQISKYLTEELSKISASIALLSDGHLEKTHVAPTKPRDGDIRFADGTNWNPGGTGAGIYAYHSGAWNKLG